MNFHSNLESQTRLETFSREKHSSLLRTSVNYGLKKFYNLATLVWPSERRHLRTEKSNTRCQCYKTFFSSLQTTRPNKPECLYLTITFQSSLTFAGNTRSLPKKEASERSSNWVCSQILRPDWKGFPRANPLACWALSSDTKEKKSFTTLTPVQIYPCRRRRIVAVFHAVRKGTAAKHRPLFLNSVEDSNFFQGYLVYSQFCLWLACGELLACKIDGVPSWVMFNVPSPSVRLPWLALYWTHSRS